jgi:hypothetical protein
MKRDRGKIVPQAAEAEATVAEAEAADSAATVDSQFRYLFCPLRTKPRDALSLQARASSSFAYKKGLQRVSESDEFARIQNAARVQRPLNSDVQPAHLV